jgi:hypothetical protein
MEHFDLQDDYRNIVIIEEYDGKIALIMGELGKNDGAPYKRWGKLKIGKDKYAQKDMPWKVSLGTRDQAVVALQFFLAELGHTVKATLDPDDNMPF